MRWLHEARFVAAAATPEQLPVLPHPEVAFVGRSNVGKSSLLNALVGNRKVARVSKTPGRTQQILFFVVDDRLTFVDLPGYGYAKVPESVRQSWKRLVEAYLRSRPQLCLVVMLVDVRRALEAEERALLAWLRESHRNVTLVVTKVDKATQRERAQCRRLLETQVPGQEVVWTSAAKGEGIAELWRLIRRHCELHPAMPAEQG